MLGATGDVGRQICTQLIERRVLPATSRLQLVGRRGGVSARAAYGLRADLIDAYDEHAPLIDVALDPADVVADVVVVAAGMTTPAAPGGTIDRSALAAANQTCRRVRPRAGRPRFRARGRGGGLQPGRGRRGGDGTRAGRHRVIGMGAWLDTLRFRREIAVSLGLRRHRIGGFVAGQHGTDLVPLWSTVRISGLDAAERQVPWRGCAPAGRWTTWTPRSSGPRGTCSPGTPPRRSPSSTPCRPICCGHPPLAHPHQRGEDRDRHGERHGGPGGDGAGRARDRRGRPGAARRGGGGRGRPLTGVVGAPVVLGPEGWTRVLLEDLAPDETTRLLACVDRIAASLEPWEGTP